MGAKLSVYTHQKTFDFSLFPTIKWQCSSTLFPLLGLCTLNLRLQGCRCSFFVYLHSFILLLYLTLKHALLLSIVYLLLYLTSQHALQLSSMSPCFLTCFIALMMLAQLSWAMICLNALLALRSTCLHASCHACDWIYMFMCSLPCLGVQIYMLGVMSSVWLCLYVSCYAIFLCFGSWAGCRSRSRALGLHP